MAHENTSLFTVNFHNAFTMIYKEYFKTYANIKNTGVSLFFCSQDSLTREINKLVIKSIRCCQQGCWNSYKPWVRVLDLAEIELIFPIAALTVLGSAWISRKVLIIHQCYAYSWAVLVQHQSCLCNIPTLPPHQQAGGRQNLGRGHNQNSWAKLNKGVFHIAQI